MLRIYSLYMTLCRKHNILDGPEPTEAGAPDAAPRRRPNVYIYIYTHRERDTCIKHIYIYIYMLICTYTHYIYIYI